MTPSWFCGHRDLCHRLVDRRDWLGGFVRFEPIIRRFHRSLFFAFSGAFVKLSGNALPVL